MQKMYKFIIFNFTCTLLTLQLFAQKNTLVMGSVANFNLVNVIELQVNQKYLNNRVDHYRSNILEDGSFAFAVEVNEPQVATILFARNKALIYLEPGDTLLIDGDANSFQYSLKFSGKGGANNTFYAQYLKQHPPQLNPLALLQYRKGIHWFANSPEMDNQMQIQGEGQFSGEMIIRRQNALTDLTGHRLNHPGTLSKDFVEFMTTEITADWAYHMLLYGLVYKNVHQLSDEFNDFVNEINVDNPVIGSYWNRKFLMAYINYLDMKAGSGDSPYKSQYELAETVFSDKALAFVQSELLKLAFNAKRVDEVLTKYAYFTENNQYNEFDDKVVAAFQKAMKYSVGTPAPYFEGVSINGQNFQLYEHTGKVILLNFWASWCHPCMKKMKAWKPLLHELEQRGVVFVNVSLDRNMETWKNTVEENQFQGIHLLADGGVKSKIPKAYDVKALPEYFIIDKNGSFAEKPDKYELEEIRYKLQTLAK